MEKLKETLQGTKLAGIVGSIVIIIAVFLPIIKASVLGISVSASFIEGNGKFVLILTIINLLIIFAPQLAGSVEFFKKLNNQKFTLIPTIINIIFLIVFIANYGSLEYKEFAHLGIGFYLLIIGIILSLAYGLLYKQEDA